MFTHNGQPIGKWRNTPVTSLFCHFQQTAAQNVSRRMHYSSGVGWVSTFRLTVTNAPRSTCSALAGSLGKPSTSAFRMTLPRAASGHWGPGQKFPRQKLVYVRLSALSLNLALALPGQVLPVANSLDRTPEGELHFGTGQMGNSGLSANPTIHLTAWIRLQSRSKLPVTQSLSVNLKLFRY